MTVIGRPVCVRTRTGRRARASILVALFGALSAVLCGCLEDTVWRPGIVTHPSDQTAAVGETATFTVEATGSGTITYQWKKDGVEIDGAAEASYTTPPVALADDGVQFTCVVTNEGGSRESQPGTLVMTLPAIATHPVHLTVTEGEAASFTVEATGCGELGHRWRRDGTDIADATEATHVIDVTPLAADGAQFTCVVSNLATLTVNMAPPRIVSQPADRTVYEGKTATFAVAAAGSGTLTYQWGQEGTDIPGASNPSYTTPATTLADTGVRFGCDVANEAGSITSDTVMLTVVLPAPGSLAWVKSAGGASWDWGSDVAVLSDGSAFVTGGFGRTATFGAGESGETHLTPVGGYDVFLARYNPDGTLGWATSAGGTGDDNAYGLAVLSDGCAFITGKFEDTATFGAGESGETSLTSAGFNGDCDVFLARYDSDGTLRWAKRAGGPSTDRAFDLAVLSDGSAFVTGSFHGVATFGEFRERRLTSVACDDAFLARYNPDGTISWAKSMGGSGYENSFGVAVLSDGAAFVTGEVWYGAVTFGAGEPGETSLASAEYVDAFLARYNYDGTIGWARSVGGIGYEGGSSVAVLSDGSVLSTGVFAGTATFGAGEPGETSATAVGSCDLFLARYDPGGDLRWAKCAGGIEQDRARDVAVLSDGSAFVTGDLEDTATFGAGESGETSLTSAGDDDTFLTRYSSDGALRWAKRAGGIGRDCGYGVAVLSDGSAFVAGLFNGTATFGTGEVGETVLISAGVSDMFIARYYP